VAERAGAPSALRRFGWLALVGVLAIAGAVILLGSDADESGADRFFGVVPQGPLEPADYARMGDGNVGTLRFLLTWLGSDPSPEPDDYVWTGFDEIVAQSASNGVGLLPFLYGTPEWAARLDGSDCTGPGCGTFAPRSQAALEAWAEWVGAVVDRYGPEGEFWAENPDLPEQPIRAWQIWNEQNSPSFYQPEPDIGAYAELLAAAEAAIHERDPGAEVITGGMFGTPLKGRLPAYTAWDFLERLYAIDGAERTFDGVGVHPYAANLTKIESQVELMREAVAGAGDDAGLWITEIGWASGGAENPLNKGPAGQAQQLDEAYQLFLDRRSEWRIEAVTWFSWRDYAGEGLCVWCPDSGLFEEEELEPKPSWDAFTELTGGT
jgi:hypothetical protein